MKFFFLLVTAAVLIFFPSLIISAQVTPSVQIVSPPPPEIQNEKAKAFGDLKVQIETLQTSTAMTANMAKHDRKEVQLLIERAEVNLNYIEFSTSAKDIPKEYLDLLRTHTRLVANLSRTIATKERLTTLREITADLEAKADSAQQCKDDPEQHIPLTGHTKRGADDVSGFEVWWVTSGDANGSGQRFGGGNPTSPILGGMFPGKYLMWAQNPSTNNQGNRKPVTVTCAGDKEFSVPAP